MDKKVVIDSFQKLIKEKKILDFAVPTSLFHYTDANGLKTILETGAMYASPTFSTNDPSELMYGWKIVEEVCAELLVKNENNTTSIKLSNAIKYPTNFPILHLMCFSTDGDNLSQWRSYADNGNGFSLEINVSSLLAPPDQWAFYKCIYNREQQKQKVIDLISISEQVNESLEHGKYFDLVFDWFGWSLWSLISTFKHHSYSDEKEWRCKITSQLPFEYVTYIKGSHLKASHPVFFKGHSVINKIIIGPKNNPEISKLAIQTLLTKSKIVLKEKIKVVISDAPYR